MEFNKESLKDGIGEIKDFFNVSKEREQELRKDGEPLVRKLQTTPDYESYDLLPDLVALAQTDNEQAFLVFMAGLMIGQQGLFMDTQA